MEATATFQEMKDEAIRRMIRLDIYKPYINAFKANKQTNKQTVTMFENFGGYWVWQYPELEAKIKEFEEEHNCVVYAVTHEYTDFGETYDFLYVTNRKDEWTSDIYVEDNVKYLYAYCWNVDDEFCSEFGEVGIQCFDGGLRRVA